MLNGLGSGVAGKTPVLSGVLELVAEDLGAIVSDEDALRLPFDDATNVGGQILLECFFVVVLGVVFAALDLGEDAFVASSQFFLQFKPLSVKRSADTSLAVGIGFAEALHLGFQFAGELPALQRLLVEPVADLRTLDVLSRIAIAVLSVAAS